MTIREIEEMVKGIIEGTVAPSKEEVLIFSKLVRVYKEYEAAVEAVKYQQGNIERYAAEERWNEIPSCAATVAEKAAQAAQLALRLGDLVDFIK